MSSDQRFGRESAPVTTMERRRFLKGVAVAGTGAIGATLLGDALRRPTFAATSRGGVGAAALAADPTDLPWGLYANNPFGPVGQQRVILDAMRRALRGAPPGATAHLTAYTGIETLLADDIVAAHRRGVSCRVSMDNVMDGNNNQLALARVLGTDRRKRSCFVSLVGTGRAGGGNAHGKLFAIDSTGSRGKAFTMVGSSNLGTHDTYQKWNTMYGTGRPKVYEWFAGIHEQMLVDEPLAHPYRKGGPFGRTGMCTTFVYPELDPDWESDDRFQFLATIDPAGARVYTTQHLWALGGHGKRLAEMLLELVAAGARVFVNGGRHCRPAVIDFLRSGGVDAARCGRPGNGTMVWPHCKYWAVVSPADESCKVRDGSLNTGSDDRGEDVAIEINSRDAAAAYAQPWALVRRVAQG